MTIAPRIFSMLEFVFNVGAAVPAAQEIPVSYGSAIRKSSCWLIFSR